MIITRTHKGTEVNVSFTPDVEPNEGGFYCTVEKTDSEAWLDDFCIHPEDCDCSDLNEVERFAREYIEKIKCY